MRPIYFAHGYREREAPLASYFGKLMGKIDFIPSLDPPSGDVNSAKLERHLRYTEGLVAVLTAREEGPSLHILYEISMAIRTRKPSLVFVEDTLPENILPPGALHCRFSARSYVRELRDHFHALEILRGYMGEKQLPRYRVSDRQRTCVLAGVNDLSSNLKKQTVKLLEKRGYKLLDVSSDDSPVPLPGNFHYNISDADLSISIVNSKSIMSVYALAVSQSMLVPTILLATNGYPLTQNIPEEYQRRLIYNDDIDKSLEIIDKQIELYEEDFLEIDSEGKAEKYADQLAGVSLQPGHYSQDIRTQIIQEVTMGDKYEAGQVGAQGPYAHAHDMTFNQIWNQAKGNIDLPNLSKELKSLREELQKSAKNAEDFAEIGAVADAEIEAQKGDGPKALSALAKVGKWTLGVAEKIGVGVATAAIKAACGF
jgi:DNA segregation ATPase FtsK/SpoIIIE-like protein